jgi:hypothetical protein
MRRISCYILVLLLMSYFACIEDIRNDLSEEIATDARINKIKNIDASDPENIKKLVDMLNDEGGSEAVLKLTEFGPQTIPFLAEAMNDEDKITPVLDVLIRLGPNLGKEPVDQLLATQLTRLLSKESGGNHRDMVARVIEKIGPAAGEFAVPAIIEDMQNHPDDFPAEYIYVFDDMGPASVKEGLEVIEMALYSENTTHQNAALSVFVRNADNIPEIVTVLTDASNQDEYPSTRLAAITGLVKLNLETKKYLVDAIFEAVETYSVDFEYERFPEPPAFVFVVPLYISSAVCNLCCLAVDNPEIAALMHDLIINGDENLRQVYAFGLIACYDCEGTLTLLAEMLKDNSAKVRFAALASVSTIKLYEFSEELVQVLMDISINDPYIHTDLTYPNRELANRILELRESKH